MTTTAGLSSNWEHLRKRLQTTSSHQKQDSTKRKLPVASVSSQKIPFRGNDHIVSKASTYKRRRMETLGTNSASAHSAVTSQVIHDLDSVSMLKLNASDPDVPNCGLNNNISPGKYIALDCEMVGFGPSTAENSQLARASIVDFNGRLLYDSYVTPQFPVTDYRTPISGILPYHLSVQTARPFSVVQKDVSGLMNGRILVGHALRHDLTVLMLSHPKRDIRDTSRHPEFRKLSMGKTPALKRLALEHLGLKIQSGAHSSIEDARVAMVLFRRNKDAFERELIKQFGRSRNELPVPCDSGEITVTTPVKRVKKQNNRRRSKR